MGWTKWENSESAIVAAYRYEERRGILQIRSRRSGRTREFRCDPALLEEFVHAPSQGWFLTRLSPVKRRWRLLPQRPATAHTRIRS